MKVKIRTLTPIWTGDIDQKSDLLRPSSITGSLRWRTEAILRSIGRRFNGGTHIFHIFLYSAF